MNARCQGAIQHGPPDSAGRCPWCGAKIELPKRRIHRHQQPIGELPYGRTSGRWYGAQPDLEATWEDMEDELYE